MMYGPCGMMIGPWSILLWIILLALIVLVIYRFLKPSHHEGHSDNPLDILKARYAKGEMTKEEFEEKKKDLGF